LEKLNSEGKKVYNGVESDVRRVIKDVIEMSKKNIDKIPMKKKLEDKISKGIESIPVKLNLPSRHEIDSLTSEITKVKELTGLLSICASCKKIRDDKGYWNQLEEYIESHSEASFSHGMCPDCSDKLYGHEDWYVEMKKSGKKEK